MHAMAKTNKIFWCYEVTLFKLNNVNLVVNSNLNVGKCYITHEFTK
jgi:hypothetical protein